MQFALGTNRKAVFAALAHERNFTAFAAQNHVAASNRVVATQNRSLVQTTSVTNRSARFTSVPGFLELAARTTKRSLELCLVRVRDSHLFLAAATYREHECRQKR
jgi:hypothetical protein